MSRSAYLWEREFSLVFKGNTGIFVLKGKLVKMQCVAVVGKSSGSLLLALGDKMFWATAFGKFLIRVRQKLKEVVWDVGSRRS